MRNQTETISKLIRFINNEEEEGGLWLPKIQRKFVWSEKQIETLFDSIMREYPISSLLIWKTKSEIDTRKFIASYNSKIKITDLYIENNNKIKNLVLDGQQRLQSLYIALKGSYENKELYFNILSGVSNDVDELKYEFKFFDKKNKKISGNWIKFKDIINSSKQYDDIAEDIIDNFKNKKLEKDEKKIIRNNIARIIKLFKTDEIIPFQKLDSVEDNSIYDENDIVEVFIRANSGGTKLEKSDLLFSLLTANWSEAEENIELLQEELNSDGFKFSRDFILKTCLTLLDTGAKYDVKKFRNKENLKKIEEQWEGISNAIKDVKDFLVTETYVRTDKAMPSYLPLIPLIYFRFKYRNEWDKRIKNLDLWLLKVLVTGAFSGSPDGLIDKIIKKINENKTFIIDDINEIIINSGRNINITKDLIKNTYYGYKDLYLLFNLWYSQHKFNFKPSFKGNELQIDHIFPQSKLKEIKELNEKTGRHIMRYNVGERDEIANCMLLTQKENGASGKTDKLPEVWFDDKDDEYLEMHLIPKDKKLWKLKNFEEFKEERTKLLIEEFLKLLN